MGSKKNKRKSAQAGSVATEIRRVNPAPGYSVDSPASAGKAAFWSTKYFERLVLAIGSVVAYFVLTSRLTGVTVSVLIDEYVYVLDAHYKEFTESGYPNHLFQLVYSSTKACGAEFYECARGINAGFVVASAVIVYFLAIYLSKSKLLGAAAWAVTVFGTFGTYTAYFMPEAIFNFFMVLFFFGLVKYGNSDRLVVWVGLGSVLGIAALAKPHALFVVPALLIFIYLSVWSTRNNWLKHSTVRMGPFLGALLVSKLGIGYLIAGPNGFSLFGSYGYAVSSGEAVAETLSTNTWLNVPETAFGQTLMIVMILGLALPVSLVGLLRTFRKDQETFSANRFRALFGIALLNMMAVSALFEAWQNLNTWMHTRYYGYLIPLAILVLIEAYVQRGLEKTNSVKRIVVAIFVVLSTYALFTQAVPYGANWIDAPDLAAHIRTFEISSLLIVAAISLSIFWLWNNKLAISIGIGFSLFASVFAGLYITNFLNDTFGKRDAYQEIGQLLNNYLPQDELDKTVLFGDNGVLMQRTLFYSLSGGATAIGGTHDDFDPSNLDSTARWVLSYGEPLPQLGDPHLSGPGYQLYALTGVEFNQPRNNQLDSMSGLCENPANAGWACGPETEIKIGRAFQSNALVEMVFDVGEGLAGTDLEFELGQSSGVVTVPSGRFAMTLSFQNPDQAQSLIIRSGSLESQNGGVEQRLIRLVSINTR